jgi:uncharacterized protein
MFLPALIGGCMIGLSAAILLVCNGDILGFSGIVSSVVLPPPSSSSSAEAPLSVLHDSQQHWKLVFLASFIATSHFVIGPRFQDHHHHHHQNNEPEEEHEPQHQQSILRYLVAGLLVGFGTQLGNGCTSGHGTSSGLVVRVVEAVVVVAMLFDVDVVKAFPPSLARFLLTI